MPGPGALRFRACHFTPRGTQHDDPLNLPVGRLDSDDVSRFERRQIRGPPALGDHHRLVAHLGREDPAPGGQRGEPTMSPAPGRATPEGSGRTPSEGTAVVVAVSTRTR